MSDFKIKKAIHFIGMYRLTEFEIVVYLIQQLTKKDNRERFHPANDLV